MDIPPSSTTFLLSEHQMLNLNLFSLFLSVFWVYSFFFLDSWEESLLCGMALAVSPILPPVVMEMIHKKMEMIYKILPNGPEAFGAALSRDTSEM